MAGTPRAHGLLGRVQRWSKTKLWDPFVAYLRHGADPPVLARSFALGFCLGLCPFVGVSFGMCFGCFFLSKLISYPLHLPMALLANTMAVPFELLLIVPFMRLGEFLLRAEKLDVKPAALLDLIKQLIHDPGKPALAVAHALFGWIVVIIPGCVLLTLALTPIFAAIKKRLPAMEPAESGLDGEDDVETGLIAADADRSSDFSPADTPTHSRSPDPAPGARSLLSSQLAGGGAIRSTLGSSTSGTVSPRSAHTRANGDGGPATSFRASGPGQGMNAFLPARRSATVELGTSPFASTQRRIS